MRKIMSVLAMLLFSGLLLSNCEKNSVDAPLLPLNDDNQAAIEQGVWGDVRFWEGDFMPAINPGAPNGTIIPVVREIHIYEATRPDQVERDGSFIRTIHSTFVKTVSSDEKGFFEVHLESGVYSFFTKEGQLFWGNETDNGGILMSAEVKENELSERKINITYKATF